MNIIKYGLNSRYWFNTFEKIFYSKTAPRLKPEYNNCFNILGKSISFFIFEHEGINNLCLFDVDDGSGLQEDSCKIKYNFLNKLIRENNVQDYIIFKAQLNKHEPYYDFYKDINRTIPLGYFPENYSSLFKLKKKLKKQAIKTQNYKEIDIFWIGSLIYNMGEGMNWPKNYELKYWNYGKRIAGFKALQEIAKNRKDIKIICTDKKIPPKKYFELISRSKICFDFPGVGEFTKRFIECLVFEKCVLSFKKLQEMHFDLKENIHYLAIEDEDDIHYEYSTSKSNYANSVKITNLRISPKKSLIEKIENAIDKTINDLQLIMNIEKNISQIQEYLTPDYFINYIREMTLNYFFSKG